MLKKDILIKTPIIYNNMPREELQSVSTYVLVKYGVEIKELELEVGKTAYAVIKTTSVI